MHRPEHVTTSYWPLTGQFYAGEHLTQSKQLANHMKPLAALKAKADGTTELITRNPKMSVLVASIAAGALKAAADPVNLSFLQQIQLIRRTIGDPVEYFALDNMFETLNVDMLEARESIQGNFAVGDYIRPLEETDMSEAKYDEIKYDLLKIPVKIYTPIEDIMRTVINPQEINLRTANWALKKRRERYALDALNTITNTDTISSIVALAAGAFHSTNKTASEIAEKINDHLEAQDSLLTHIAINNKTFAEYTENTWTNTGPTNMQFNRVIGAGVSPFPGVSGLTAVISPFVPVDTFFLVDKMNGARLAEGPKITRRYYDEERDAEVIKTSDFNQYQVVLPDQTKVTRQFSLKLTVT